jgi:hypothetical protein
MPTAGLLAGMVLAAGAAQAQSASSTLSPYTSGYGGVGLSGLNSPVSPNLISTQSPYSITDGVTSAGAAGSLFTSPASNSSTSGGADQSYSGVGQAAASRQRAPTQTSTPAGAARAAASATTAAPDDRVLNGKIDLDGGQ